MAVSQSPPVLLFLLGTPIIWNFIMNNHHIRIRVLHVIRVAKSSIKHNLHSQSTHDILYNFNPSVTANWQHTTWFKGHISSYSLHRQTSQLTLVVVKMSWQDFNVKKSKYEPPPMRLLFLKHLQYLLWKTYWLAWFQYTQNVQLHTNVATAICCHVALDWSLIYCFDVKL